MASLACRSCSLVCIVTYVKKALRLPDLLLRNQYASMSMSAISYPTPGWDGENRITFPAAVDIGPDNVPFAVRRQLCDVVRMVTKRELSRSQDGLSWVLNKRLESISD